MVRDISGPKPVYKILYFDLAGNPVSIENIAFEPPWEEPPKTGLCTEFTTSETTSGKSKTLVETCRDGTFRLQQVTELNESGRKFRVFEKDAKDRTVSDKYEYDSAGELTRWTTEIAVPGEPFYSAVAVFAMRRRDDHGREIRNITTVTINSSHVPISQYIEEILLTYFDE